MLWQNKTKQMRTCSSLVIIEMKLINFFILAIQQDSDIKRKYKLRMGNVLFMNTLGERIR